MNDLNVTSNAKKVGVTGCIFGKSGIGKTSLLWTLDPKRTLFVDLEAGDLAVSGWEGKTLRPRTWDACKDLASFIGGVNPSLTGEQSYSSNHYEKAKTAFGDPTKLDEFDTIFIDSITVAGRLCLNWCKGQSQAFSEKKGKPDMRGAYGLHGQEMIAWLTHLQHTRNKNIWFLGILDEKLDDHNNRFFSAQIEGSKTGLELPGIVDEVITMADVMWDNGKKYRAFVCQTINEHGYPAKDRSGKLNVFEKPHLGNLMEKISNGPRKRPAYLTYEIPENAQSKTPAVMPTNQQENKL